MVQRGMMTPEDLSGKSDEEVLKSMHDGGFDSAHYKHCVNTLQLRYMRRTATATRNLVIATALLLIGAIANLVKVIIR